jgi:spore germination protein YaaH
MIHYVGYEDGRCLPAKLDAVRQAGCDGIVVWHLGSEEQDFWDALGKER